MPFEGQYHTMYESVYLPNFVPVNVDILNNAWNSAASDHSMEDSHIVEDCDPITDILSIIKEDEESRPHVKIVEEPATNMYRFRYKSEGDTAGTVPGERQTYARKSYPKIMLCNYEGVAQLEVCCLTEDMRVHPNKLSWRKSERSSSTEVNAGIYRAKIRGNVEEEIKLGINLSKKSDVLQFLLSKQELGVDPFCMGYSHADEKQRKDLDLNRVRLCFMVSIKRNGNVVRLPPAYTQMISHNMIRTELRIRDISDVTSSAAGGEKKILVCDKLEPTGLQIVFHDEMSGWTDFGEFNPSDVHNKSSVVFTTPVYPNLSEVTVVRMEMNKVDGSASSNPINFTYYPASGHNTLAKTETLMPVSRKRPHVEIKPTSPQPQSQQQEPCENFEELSLKRSTYTYENFHHL